MYDYPVNLRLDGQPVLVVGGGRVALQKVAGFDGTGARVTVVAPEVTDALATRAGVTIERRPYRRGEAADYRLVLAATGDAAVNQQVHDDASAAGIWVNSADDPERCTFTVPARVRQGDLLVAISTGGRSPAMAAWLREELEQLLGPEHAILLDLLADERANLQAKGVATEGLNWRGALRSGMLDRIREGHLAEARELLRACLSSSSG